MELPCDYTKMSWQEKRLARSIYIGMQGGKCYYCWNNLDDKPKKTPKINWKLFPPNFCKYPVHLHHSHVTGLTIGAVHAYCNAILWQYHGE